MNECTVLRVCVGTSVRTDPMYIAGCYDSGVYMWYPVRPSVLRVVRVEYYIVSDPLVPHTVAVVWTISFIMVPTTLSIQYDLHLVLNWLAQAVFIASGAPRAVGPAGTSHHPRTPWGCCSPSLCLVGPGVVGPGVKT